MDVVCLLPSTTPGYLFDVHLTGAWEDLPTARPHGDPPAAATDHALTVARNITATRLLTEAVAADVRINTVLGQPTDLAHASLRLIWARARLTADPQQTAAVIHQLREQHDADVHDQRDRHRLQRAKDLRDALLTDPGLALTYWFADHPETMDQHTIDRVSELAAAVTAYAPDTAWVQLAQILQDFVRQLPQDSRQHLIDSLGYLFERYGHPEHTARLRTHGLLDQQTTPRYTLRSRTSTALSRGPNTGQQEQRRAVAAVVPLVPPATVLTALTGTQMECKALATGVLRQVC